MFSSNDSILEANGWNGETPWIKYNLYMRAENSRIENVPRKRKYWQSLHQSSWIIFVAWKHYLEAETMGTETQEYGLHFFYKLFFFQRNKSSCLGVMWAKGKSGGHSVDWSALCLFLLCGNCVCSVIGIESTQGRMWYYGLFLTYQYLEQYRVGSEACGWLNVHWRKDLQKKE